MFSFFGNFTTLYGLSFYESKSACPKSKSTLERKVKTRALKGIFLVLK